MANIIITSKNRPMQLEACLRSLKKHFKEYEICKKTIIFKALNKDYIDGYKILITEYPEVSFINETDFKTNILKSIDSSNKFTMFVMDDILFKNDFSLNDKPFQIMTSYGKDHVLGVSLRLHKGITYCYATDKNARLPNFIRDIPNEACIWKFIGCEGDWGYGYSLDSDVYFTDHILDLINKIDFYNPNTLEEQMNVQWVQKSIYKPIHKICYPNKAKLINIPVNRVQNIFQNRHENSYSEEELNTKFLGGKRISLENIEDIDTNSVHYPIEYKFYDTKTQRKKMIIHQPWGGLGDNLLWSTLPELCYENNIDCYISTNNAVRNEEIYELVWGKNPYIKGAINEPPNAGQQKWPENINLHPKNLYSCIEKVEVLHGFKNKNIYPKIYYNCNILENIKNKIVVDFSSHNNSYDPKVLYNFIVKNYHLDDVLLIQHKYNFKNSYMFENIDKIVLKDIFHYCDIIYSCKEFICLYSGSSVLASAINRKNTKTFINPKDDIDTINKVKNDAGLFCFDNIEYLDYKKWL